MFKLDFFLNKFLSKLVVFLNQKMISIKENEFQLKVLISSAVVYGRSSQIPCGCCVNEVINNVTTLIERVRGTKYHGGGGVRVGWVYWAWVVHGLLTSATPAWSGATCWRLSGPSPVDSERLALATENQQYFTAIQTLAIVIHHCEESQNHQKVIEMVICDRL